MAQSKLDIREVIRYLEADATVTAAIPGGFFYGIPKNDTATQVFCSISMVSDNVLDVNRTYRLEFRVCSPTTETTTLAMQQAVDALEDALAFRGKRVFGSFTTKNVYMSGDVVPGYDSKERKLIIRDFLFEGLA